MQLRELVRKWDRYFLQSPTLFTQVTDLVIDTTFTIVKHLDLANAFPALKNLTLKQESHFIPPVTISDGWPFCLDGALRQEGLPHLTAIKYKVERVEELHEALALRWLGSVTTLRFKTQLPLKLAAVVCGPQEETIHSIDLITGHRVDQIKL
jgi:hypothetical protein